MNKAFRELAQHYQRGTGPLTHQQRVQRLYRHALRTLQHWKPRRAMFNRLSSEIREEFDANKNASKEAAKRLLREGEQRLEANTHPDPWVAPYMPGGSKFMRNPPPSLEESFPDGIPPEANISPQTVEYVQVSQSAYAPDGYTTVLVDPYKKSAE